MHEPSPEVSSGCVHNPGPKMNIAPAASTASQQHMHLSMYSMCRPTVPGKKVKGAACIVVMQSDRSGAMAGTTYDIALVYVNGRWTTTAMPRLLPL
jgi:hypothetical protein